jgi:predicted PurR-regulated permease PerM
MIGRKIDIRLIYVVLLVGALLALALPFWIPIIFAASFSLTLHPLYSLMLSKGIGRRTAAALLTTLFALIISIPLSFFLIKGSSAVTNKLESLSKSKDIQNQGVKGMVTNMREDIVNTIQKYSKRHHIDFLNSKKINEYLELVVNYFLAFFQKLLTSLPSLIIMLVIMILCTYSFLTHSSLIKSFFQKIFNFSNLEMDAIVKIFIKNSRQVYLSNIITGATQSIIVASTVSLLRQGDFFLVFFITLILSFIPVIGAAPVAFTFSIIALIKDHTSSAIVLLVIGSFTGIVDNILRPWLTTFGESKIPPIVAFVCVLGGALWLGFPGLFIGLLVGSISYDTLPIFWKTLGRGER